MEMPFNIFEISSYFHYFYSQLLFRQYKNHGISVPIERFPFFGNLKDQLLGGRDWFKTFAYDNS